MTRSVALRTGLLRILPIAGALIFAVPSAGCASASGDQDEEVSGLEDPLTTLTLKCTSSVKDEGALWVPDATFESTVSLRYVRSGDGVVFTSMLHSNSVQHRTKVHVRSSAQPDDGEFINERFYKYERSDPAISRSIKFSAPHGTTLTIRTSYEQFGRDPVSSCTVVVP